MFDFAPKARRKFFSCDSNITKFFKNGGYERDTGVAQRDQAAGMAVLFGAEEGAARKETEGPHRDQAAGIAVLFGAEGTARRWRPPKLRPELGRRDSSTIWLRGGRRRKERTSQKKSNNPHTRGWGIYVNTLSILKICTFFTSKHTLKIKMRTFFLGSFFNGHVLTYIIFHVHFWHPFLWTYFQLLTTVQNFYSF